MRAFPAPRPPRSPERPYAFTTPELLPGACAAVGAGTVLLPIALSVAGALPFLSSAGYFDPGLALYELGIAGVVVFVAGWLLMIPVIPVLSLLGRGLDRIRTSWAHLSVFAVLAAIVAGAVGAGLGSISGDPVVTAQWAAPSAIVGGISGVVGWCCAVRYARAEDRKAAR